MSRVPGGNYHADVVLRAVVDRVPAVPPALMRALAILTVVGQAGIAVTGAVVRVTGSGLGCPSWPECFPGSLVPTPHPEVAALNQWIEFGNRLLSVALVLAAGIAMLAALTVRPRRRRLVWLAVAQPLGIVAQAVIGGFVVLTGLVWWSVSIHFLTSMVFVWLAVQLVAAVSDGDGPPRPRVSGPVRALVATSSAVLGALLVAGTFVTAAGPHAGDAATPRLAVDVGLLAQLHADLLFGYLGLLIGLGFTLRATAAPAPVTRRYAWLLVAVLTQGALGGAQYALGVPEALAALHVLGAALVTVAAAALWAGTVERPAGAAPVDEPVPVPHERARAGA
jgi:cytochrome c oxidase assembly protein subunit 15